MNGQAVKESAIEQGVWGVASSIDIYECDPDLIRSAEYIRQFVLDLCELIETSLISAHFANQTNATYLDVFSCKPYDPDVVRDFAQRYFGGRSSTMHVTLRK